MIDSIRKGVIIILSLNSHVNIMECIIKQNVIKIKKGNSVVLISNTIALLLPSFSFFFLFLFSHRGHKHTHRLTSIKEEKKKKEIV